MSNVYSILICLSVFGNEQFSMSMSLISSILFAIMCRIRQCASLSFYAFTRLDERCQMNLYSSFILLFCCADNGIQASQTATHFAFFAYHFLFIPFSGRETDPAGTQNSTRTMRFDVNKLILEVGCSQLVCSVYSRECGTTQKETWKVHPCVSLFINFPDLRCTFLLCDAHSVCESGCLKESHSAGGMNGSRKIRRRRVSNRHRATTVRCVQTVSYHFSISLSPQFTFGSVDPTVDRLQRTKEMLNDEAKTNERDEKKNPLHILCLPANVSFSVTLSVRSFFGRAIAVWDVTPKRAVPGRDTKQCRRWKSFSIVIGCTALCRCVCSQHQFISIVIVSVIDEFDFFSLASHPFELRTDACTRSMPSFLCDGHISKCYN